MEKINTFQSDDNAEPSVNSSVDFSSCDKMIEYSSQHKLCGDNNSLKETKDDDSESLDCNNIVVSEVLQNLNVTDDKKSPLKTSEDNDESLNFSGNNEGIDVSQDLKASHDNKSLTISKEGKGESLNDSSYYEHIEVPQSLNVNDDKNTTLNNDESLSAAGSKKSLIISEEDNYELLNDSDNNECIKISQNLKLTDHEKSLIKIKEDNSESLNNPCFNENIILPQNLNVADDKTSLIKMKVDKTVSSNNSGNDNENDKEVEVPQKVPTSIKIFAQEATTSHKMELSDQQAKNPIIPTVVINKVTNINVTLPKHKNVSLNLKSIVIPRTEVNALKLNPSVISNQVLTKPISFVSAAPNFKTITSVTQLKPIPSISKLEKESKITSNVPKPSVFVPYNGLNYLVKKSNDNGKSNIHSFFTKPPTKVVTQTLNHPVFTQIKPKENTTQSDNPKNASPHLGNIIKVLAPTKKLPEGNYKLIPQFKVPPTNMKILEKKIEPKMVTVPTIQQFDFIRVEKPVTQNLQNFTKKTESSRSKQRKQVFPGKARSKKFVTRTVTSQNDEINIKPNCNQEKHDLPGLVQSPLKSTSSESGKLALCDSTHVKLTSLGLLNKQKTTPKTYTIINKKHLLTDTIEKEFGPLKFSVNTPSTKNELQKTKKMDMYNDVKEQANFNIHEIKIEPSDLPSDSEENDSGQFIDCHYSSCATLIHESESIDNKYCCMECKIKDLQEKKIVNEPSVSEISSPKKPIIDRKELLAKLKNRIKKRKLLSTINHPEKVTRNDNLKQSGNSCNELPKNKNLARLNITEKANDQLSTNKNQSTRKIGITKENIQFLTTKNQSTRIINIPKENDQPSTSKNQSNHIIGISKENDQLPTNKNHFNRIISIPKEIDQAPMKKNQSTPIIGIPKENDQLPTNENQSTPIISIPKENDQLPTNKNQSTPIIGVPKENDQLSTNKKQSTPIIGVPKENDQLPTNENQSTPIIGIPKKNDKLSKIKKKSVHFIETPKANDDPKKLILKQKSVNDEDAIKYIKDMQFRSASKRLFDKPFPTKNNPFKVNQKLEGIDPEHESLFCVLTVVEICGYRVKLHFDGYPDYYDFWVNADCPDIFYPGWCEKNGKILQPPKNYGKVFGWTKYISETQSFPAPQCNFISTEVLSNSKKNKFRVGAKLEAIDKMTRTLSKQLICVATVGDIIGDRIRIHFDGWDLDFDYWTDITSINIHPMGWCEKNGRILCAPRNYQGKKPFAWEDYLIETNSEPVPEDAFVRKPLREFTLNMTIEVVDLVVPKLIRIARVVDLRGDEIKILYDDFPANYAYWIEDDNPDIHPVGWSLRTNHPIEKPSEKLAGCKIPGCNGKGNLLYFNRPTHNNAKDCPYEWNVWKKAVRGLKLIDRLSPEVLSTSKSAKRSKSQTKSYESCSYEKKRKNPFGDTSEPESLQENDTLKISNKNTGEKIKNISSVNVDEYRSCYERLENENCMNNMTMEQQAAYWTRCLLLNDKVCCETDANTWSVDKVASFVNDLLYGNKNVDKNKDSVANRFKEEEIDGEAFLMLTQDEIIDILHVSLGGAIKIYNAILLLRQRTPIFEFVEEYFCGPPTP